MSSHTRVVSIPLQTCATRYAFDSLTSPCSMTMPNFSSTPRTMVNSSMVSVGPSVASSNVSCASQWVDGV